MAAGDKVQIGKAFRVEFGSFDAAGFVPDSVTSSKTGDVETVKDERNATCTYIVTDPGDTLTLNLRLDSTASLTPWAIGDIVQITPPQGTATKYIILTPAPLNFSNMITTVSATFERKAAMAATLDA